MKFLNVPSHMLNSEGVKKVKGFVILIQTNSNHYIS